jgi:predicted ATP-dependent protease
MLAHGIVLYNGLPSKLILDLQITEGTGDIFIDGLVTEEFEQIYRRAFSSVCDLIDLGEIPDTDFSAIDISLSFSHSFSDVPVTGDSYGLLLGLSLGLGLAGSELVPEICVTGALGERGEVIPVGGISEKRKGARSLGFDRIMLPHSQLDFFSKEISQIPVESFYQAWSVVNYD